MWSMKSAKDAAQAAAGSLGSMIARRPGIAWAVIALLLAIALVGWGRAIERSRVADGFLKEARQATEKLREAEKTADAWRQRAGELERSATRARDVRVGVAARLDAARAEAARGFRRPASVAEIQARFLALGYHPEVPK